MTREVRIDQEVSFGGGSFNIIAGPCSVEDLRQMEDVGEFLNSRGVKLLRAGIFKPRTSPDSFQGVGLEGLEIIEYMKRKYGFRIVSEIMDPRDVEALEDQVDIIQIGTRNMQNFALLKEVGRTNKPVILKRGLSATIDEWINAARYIEKEGNKNIILCERGIRTFEDYTRNTLDIMAVPIIQNETDYPIIVDPSHATGRRELVAKGALASKAIGADGIMIEVHKTPEKAWSDGEQSLNFQEFDALLEIIENI